MSMVRTISGGLALIGSFLGASESWVAIRNTAVTPATCADFLGGRVAASWLSLDGCYIAWEDAVAVTFSDDKNTSYAPASFAPLYETDAKAGPIRAFVKPEFTTMGLVNGALYPLPTSGNGSPLSTTAVTGLIKSQNRDVRKILEGHTSADYVVLEMNEAPTMGGGFWFIGVIGAVVCGATFVVRPRTPADPAPPPA